MWVAYLSISVDRKTWVGFHAVFADIETFEFFLFANTDTHHCLDDSEH